MRELPVTLSSARWSQKTEPPEQSVSMRTEESSTRGPEDSSATSEERSGTATGRLRRTIAWVAGNRIKAGLLVCAFLVSTGGVVVLWLTLASANTGGRLANVTLEAALAALDRGSYVEARQHGRDSPQAEDASRWRSWGDRCSCWAQPPPMRPAKIGPKDSGRVATCWHPVIWKKLAIAAFPKAGRPRDCSCSERVCSTAGR